MTNLPERATETALEDLTDRSILTSDLSAQTYFLPPLTAKFIRTRRPDAVTQTGDALTNRAYALAMQYGGDSENYEKFPALDAEWDFVSAALPRLLAGDNARLQTVCSQLFQFLHFTGRLDDAIWLTQRAEEYALSVGNKHNAGRRAYEAGWVYSIRKQVAEVLACAERATKHWQDTTPFIKTTAIHLRGIGHMLQKDYPSAITTYREVLENYRNFAPGSNYVSNALQSLAGAEQANEDYVSAERDYREALRIAKILKDDHAIASYTGNLASLALDREQWAEAESLACEALALAEKVGRQELIANDSHHLAKALLMQNPNDKSALSEAEGLSRRAIEIFTRLRHPNLQSAQETLKEIEKKINSE